MKKLPRRRLAAIVATVSALWITPGQAQPRPPNDGPALVGEANGHLWWGDFESLERLHREVDGPGKLDADGLARIQRFREGVGQVVRDLRETGDAYLVELEALTLRWATERPLSALAHTLHARTLVARAWAYRGDGFARSVTPEGWRQFALHLDRAARHLASVDAVVETDSSAHRELLVVGRGLGWSLAQQQRIAERGLRANPDDIGLWGQLVVSALPKWQGDAAEVDRVIRRAAQATQGRRGDDLYARLYADAADGDFSHALFEDSRADWPRMRKGFRDMLQRWPDSTLNWNRFAYVACLARDRETLSEALDRVKDKPLLEAWGNNARRTFDGCQKLARQT
jgi:hypothetical protein